LDGATLRSQLATLKNEVSLKSMIPSCVDYVTVDDDIEETEQENRLKNMVPVGNKKCLLFFVGRNLDNDKTRIIFLSKLFPGIYICSYRYYYSINVLFCFYIAILRLGNYNSQ
jgi:hypothetical protein